MTEERESDFGNLQSCEWTRGPSTGHNGGIIEQRKRVETVKTALATLPSNDARRLERLVELNHIGKMEFLPGSKEAELFASQQYLAVHWSTLRKADMLANILGRIGDGTLKTTASWWERNGVPLRAIPEMVKEHPIYIGLGIAAVLLAFVTRLFGVIELVERLGDPPDASAVTPAQAPAPSPSVPATLP